jgi:hypothetical protein
MQFLQKFTSFSQHPETQTVNNYDPKQDRKSGVSLTLAYCSRTLVREEATRWRHERISFMLSPLFICICLTHLCLLVFSYIYLSFFLCFFLSCPFFRLPLFTAFFLLLSRDCLSLPLLLLFLFISCSF